MSGQVRISKDEGVLIKGIRGMHDGTSFTLEGQIFEGETVFDLGVKGLDIDLKKHPVLSTLPSAMGGKSTLERIFKHYSPTGDC